MLSIGSMVKTMPGKIRSIRSSGKRSSTKDQKPLAGGSPWTRWDHRATALAIAHGVCDIYRFAFLRPPLDQAVTREYQRYFFGPRWRMSPLYGHASFEDTAPGLDLPPILVIASEPDAYFSQSRRLIRYLDRSPLEHEVILWTRAQGERLTHVFEVSHWDWPESRETNRRMLDFFDWAARRMG